METSLTSPNRRLQRSLPSFENNYPAIAINWLRSLLQRLLNYITTPSEIVVIVEILLIEKNALPRRLRSCSFWKFLFLFYNNCDDYMGTGQQENYLGSFNFAIAVVHFSFVKDVRFRRFEFASRSSGSAFAARLLGRSITNRND